MNPAEQTINDTSLVREVADLRRELEALKTRQLIGLDNIVYLVSEEVVFHLPISAGGFADRAINYFSQGKHIYASEPQVTVFLNNDNDTAYSLPGGVALSFPNGEPGCEVSWRHDQTFSDMTGAGNKYYIFRVRNNSVNTVTFHLHVRLIYPASVLT